MRRFLRTEPQLGPLLEEFLSLKEQVTRLTPAVKVHDKLSLETLSAALGSCCRICSEVGAMFGYMWVCGAFEKDFDRFWGDWPGKLIVRKQKDGDLWEGGPMHAPKIACHISVPKAACQHFISEGQLPYHWHCPFLLLSLPRLSRRSRTHWVDQQKWIQPPSLSRLAAGISS